MARGKAGISLNARFGKRLRSLRKGKRWTFVYMSEVSGVAVGFLHALEQGTKEPCLNTIDVLAKSFGMSISEFTDGV
jgi:transcriptional regulator with XRE-family HTH domain